jgi:hypothetical protein
MRHMSRRDSKNEWPGSDGGPLPDHLIGHSGEAWCCRRETTAVITDSKSLAAQAAEKGAPGFLAQHISIGQAPLADRLLDQAGKPARHGAEKLLAGTDQFAGGKGRLLLLGRLCRCRERPCCQEERGDQSRPYQGDGAHRVLHEAIEGQVGMWLGSIDSSNHPLPQGHSRSDREITSAG